MVAAVIAVIAGLRAGICMTAAPRSIRSVCPAIQASMLGESEPYASAAQTTEIAEPVGLLGHGEVVGGRGPRGLVAEAESEPHVPSRDR